MNTKTTLLALAVAIVLGAYFLVFETDMFDRKTASTREKEKAIAEAGNKPGQPLFKADDLPLDKVRTIRIEVPNGPPIVFQRHAADSEEWNQTEPVAFGLQAFMIRDIISDASQLRYTSTLKPDGKENTLETFGLSPAKMILTFEGEGMIPKTIALGFTTGAGRAYVTLDKPSGNSSVYIVGDRLQQTVLSKKLKDFRNTTLVNLEPGAARRVVLTREDKSVELAQADGRWSIIKPVTGRADRDGAQELARSLSTVLVDKFVVDKPANLEMFGLDKPQTTLTVDIVQAVEEPKKPEAGKDDAKKDEAKKDESKKDQKPAEKIVTYKLAIGAAQDPRQEHFYAMWNDSPVVFTLRKADVEKLNKTVDGLRDPRLTPAIRSDVRDVKVEQAAGPVIHIAQDKGAWSFADPKPSFTLDAGSADQLVNALCDTKASTYLPADQIKGKKLAQITLMLAAKAEADTLTITEHTDGQVVVLRGGESAGYVVDKQHLSIALEPVLSFRNRNVIDISENSLAGVAINRTGKFPLSVTITRAAPEAEGPPAPGAPGSPAAKKDDKAAPKPGDWKLDGLDAVAVRSLISKLTPLRADSWLSESTITTPEGVNIELTLGDNTKHKIFVHLDSGSAKVEGVDAAFKVNPETIQALAAELKDPVALKLSVDQITSITSSAWTLLRDSDGKIAFENNPNPLNQQAAGALFDAVAGLRVDHYIAAAPKVAALTLKIKTREGKEYTLAVGDTDPAYGLATASVDGKHFTLSKETQAALNAAMIESPADAAKKAMQQQMMRQMMQQQGGGGLPPGFPPM